MIKSLAETELSKRARFPTSSNDRNAVDLSLTEKNPVSIQSSSTEIDAPTRMVPRTDTVLPITVRPMIDEPLIEVDRKSPVTEHVDPILVFLAMEVLPATMQDPPIEVRESDSIEARPFTVNPEANRRHACTEADPPTTAFSITDKVRTDLTSRFPATDTQEPARPL